MQVAPQADIRYAMARSQAAIAVPGFRLPHILKANEGEEPTMACSSSGLHHGQGMTPIWPLTLFFLPAQRSPNQGQQRAEVGTLRKYPTTKKLPPVASLVVLETQVIL